MFTKCPNCATSFRVTPAQLKARAGTVRCGQCRFVFNALDALAEQPVSTLVTQAAPSLPIETPPSDTLQEPASSPPAYAVEIAREGMLAAAEGMPDVEAVAADAETAAGSVADTMEQDLSPIGEDYLADPSLHEAPSRLRRWPWVLGSAVAVLGLLLQAAYYYRVELAVLRPDLRPLLLAACETLHCDVPRPRHIGMLGIDASDLRPDLERPGHLTLTATLRSKAPFALEWPFLELTLTDVADRKLAVRHFAAATYLRGDKDSYKKIAAGFPANGEIAFSLPLAVGDLPAAGYRLYIFYP